MDGRDVFHAFVIIPTALLFSGFLIGQLPTPGVLKKKAIVDVRFDQRTVLVADPNKKSLTLTPGAEGQNIWVCAPHDGGKSCKAADEVVSWILANGIDH